MPEPMKAVIDTGTPEMRDEIYARLGFPKPVDNGVGFTFVFYDEAQGVIGFVDPVGAKQLIDDGYKRYIRVDDFYKDMGL